jgi:hypothetical protein
VGLAAEAAQVAAPVLALEMEVGVGVKAQALAREGAGGAGKVIARRVQVEGAGRSAEGWAMVVVA